MVELNNKKLGNEPRQKISLHAFCKIIDFNWLNKALNENDN